MNIIVVVSDTLRRDYLSAYGNNKIIDPNLTAFAERALVFEDAYPASFPTVPTRSDLMTGKYSLTYLPWGPLPQGEETLANLLTRAGYATAAIADTPFLTRNGYGHDRGFKEFIYVRGQLDGTERDYLALNRPGSEEEGYCAPKTMQEAARWLQRHHEKKFFLYVDTWDPHEPWDPPAYYVKPYLPDYDGRVVSPNYWSYEEDGYTERDLEVARACYSGEITMVDRWFGHLMEQVRVLGLLENTAILFFSDHGFYFGEHGLFGKRRFRWPDDSGFEEGFAKGHSVHQRTVHRSPLHNELVRVPLFMYLPGEAARRVPGLVQLPDVMPTVLELAGVPIPQQVQARSLMPLVRGETEQLHDIVVSSAPLEEVGTLSKTVDDQAREIVEVSPSTISDGEWDLLYAVSGQKVELYRRNEDPQHKKNVAAQHPEVVRELHARFVAWLQVQETPERHLEPRRSL